MPVIALTPDGVLMKQVELYALATPLLLVEAQAAAADLEAWLTANFTMTPKQATYLAGLPDPVRFHIGAIIGAAMISRSPITMEGPSDYGPPRRTKEIVIEPCGETWYRPPLSGSAGIEGSLPVAIHFALID